ncbi:cytochrome c oxidase subunit II [Aeromicrobium endophyticum]|jgi:cytochrome c oxidase subunit 2|uniref:Cytochrome c oxidase subunit 2 n=1 Tax=Aeromicrobium endophyticum TaxID=2292704 RepID=A0A371P3C5_9ACTN|nr:cytochrome c oxidase subunit II [Aeromicrobium endophyticum]REK70442.1 cytochrome c oxidase subunit II [Aeromicrobium endophyticum]
MKLAVVLLAAVVLSGCAPDADSDLARLALPVGSTDRTQDIWELWLGAWIAVLVIFLLVFGLIVYSMIRYRRRSDDEIPAQIRYNLPIEALYTFAPVIIVAVFFFHTVTSQNNVLERVDNPDHTVEVVGSKWQWAFNYLDEDATQGEDVFDVGTPQEPAELWLPVGESVRFKLKSPDVIHSFWIPEFYFKMDVVPGKVNTFDLSPTREGVFTGRCAELCGLYHSRMIFKVHVVSRAEYDSHLEELKQADQVGAPQGAKEANEIAGLRGEDKSGKVAEVQGDGTGKS